MVRKQTYLLPLNRQSMVSISNVSTDTSLFELFLPLGAAAKGTTFLSVQHLFSRGHLGLAWRSPVDFRALFSFPILQQQHMSKRQTVDMARNKVSMEHFQDQTPSNSMVGQKPSHFLGP